MLLPLARLLDLIAINQIKTEGFKYKKHMSDQEELSAMFMMR